MTTRTRILEILEKQRSASAAELSRALGVTPANIRHHLHALQEQGLVLVSAQRPLSKRGRPTLLYELASQASRHNLDGLAAALLSALLDGLPPAERDAALARLAGALLGEGAARPGTHLTRRLYQAVQQFNAMGYQARWEAHKQA
ncbi:MAG: ArsR family transcriptional regulator, partial [Chloroflexi bacterium]|nr:ArsR family transcriptional regulator [Chloroflexota bacterium]